MRRREVLGWVAGLGVLAGAGSVAHWGRTAGSGDEGRRDPGHDPVALVTVDAPGSDEGTLVVPETGRPTLVDLFATNCAACRDQMPALGEAHDRVGDRVTVVSVTTESERVADNEALAGWWADHDGRWSLARDPTADLLVHYGTTTPTAVLFDADGRVAWEDSGRKTAAEFVENVRQVLEDDADP